MEPALTLVNASSHARRLSCLHVLKLL